MKNVNRFLLQLFGRMLQRLPFWLCRIWLLGLIWIGSVVGDEPQSRDRFYIPRVIDPHFRLDGSIDTPEWDGANWFAFGTEGNPEVTVFGRYQEDSLFLAFRIDFESLDDRDKLTICIDPFVAGTSKDLDPFIRYDLMIKNSAQTFSTWDHERNNWIQQSLPEYFQGNCQLKTYQNTSKRYAEVEVKINCRQIASDFGREFFGLYVLFCDWINSADYLPFWWPKDAPAPDPINLTLPSADHWAHAILVSDSTQTQADIFFDCRQQHLKTTNENDLTIMPGKLNTLKVRVNNRYVPGAGAPNGGAVSQIPLQLYYRDFGLGNFTPINSTPDQFDLPANGSVERSIPWHTPIGPENLPDTVSLRAELLLTSDPIRCNNSTRRTMQYLKVVENEAAKVTITLQNTSEGFSVSPSSTYYASTAPFSFSDLEPSIGGSDNYLYLYLDRTAIDPLVPDSLWNIRFATLITTKDQDSLVYLSDRDSLWFGPTASKSTKKLLLQFKAPDYSYFSKYQDGRECRFWQWLKSIFCRKSEPVSDMSLVVPSKGVGLMGEHPFGEYGSPIYALTIKVTRKAKTVELNDRMYHCMSVVGYSGVIFQVVPKPLGFMDFLKWIGLVVAFLLSSAYLYLKRWLKRQKPDRALRSGQGGS